MAEGLCVCVFDQFVQVHFSITSITSHICSVAQWFHRNPSSTNTHTHTLSIYLSLRDCISYTGTQCSEVLHADWKVFLSNTSINLEDHLSQAIQLSGQFSEKCRVFVKSALCHTLLPYCDPFHCGRGPLFPPPHVPAELCATGGEVWEGD